MALTEAGLSAAIVTELAAVSPVSGFPGAATTRQAFADAVAKAVIQYLLVNNVVIHPMGPGRVT